MKTTLLSLLFVSAATLTAGAQGKPGVVTNPNNTGSTTTTTTTVPATAKQSTAVMSFRNLEHNYGKIEQGQSVTHEFVFTNTGKEPLVISNAQGSCGCTVPVWPKEPIAPGKTGTIKVTFNSAGKMGAQDKTVTLTSNNKDGVVVLHMKGEVTAKPASTNDKTNAISPVNGGK
ncbi:MAG TPA: DUF1573 domain-containing protein [Flavobacteriales bacterium]|nr:DUF1573 domain-containing protein [Flavobacteriales bacterium]